MNLAATEFGNLNVGDPRRDRRAMSLFDCLSAKPTASIPQACGGWVEAYGAYRFFGNDQIQWEGILKPYIQCPVAHMAAHERVLCIQDATEPDFNGKRSRALGR